MDDLPITAAVFSAWADVKQFLVGVRFARPLLLWLSLLPVVVSLLGLLAARRKRAQLARFGRPAAVAGLLIHPTRTSRFSRLFLGLAWSALVLGVAGPRWGRTTAEGVAVGRDIVIVLDFSRSMWATDLNTPTPRWKAAVDAARELVAYCRTRGGHRIGVVVFAARPKLWVPLTTDYNHLDTKLADLDATQPPNDIRPADDTARSGTRIGAALKLAVGEHDPRFTGSQDIVLLTDGDDPEPDREWAGGVTAARAAQIPVHVVGIGNPADDFPLIIKPRGDDLVLTRLDEGVARGIAAEGRGEYLPARTTPPDLADFFRTRVEPFPTRTITDDTTTQLRDRSVWFFLAAAGLLALGWWRER